MKLTTYKAMMHGLGFVTDDDEYLQRSLREDLQKQLPAFEEKYHVKVLRVKILGQKHRVVNGVICPDAEPARPGVHL